MTLMTKYFVGKRRTPSSTVFALWVGIFLSTTAMVASGETDSTTVTASAKARLDFAVPDAPAFQILEPDESAILRPGSAREFALMLENADLRNLAVEFAPFQLLMGIRGLADYQKHRLRNNLSVSAATKPGGLGTNVAFGLRLSVNDGADPRMDAKLTTVAKRIGNQWQDAKDQAMDELGPPGNDAEAYAKAVLTRARAIYGVSATEQLDAAIEEQQRRAWNASLLEFGFAVGATTPDTTEGEPQATAYSAWETGAIRFGKNGQALLGFRGSAEREPGGHFDKGKGALGVRAYWGSSVGRGLLEGDGTWQDGARPHFTWKAGGEYQVIAGLWVTASAGLEQDGGDPARIVHEFHLRYGQGFVIPGL